MTPLSPEKRKLLRQRFAAPTALGHDVVAATLRQLGVTHIYGLSGSPIHETLARCAGAGLRVIGVRHQQAGVFAAAAHNYVAGRLRAVSIISAGPAVTNAATGILTACDNCWPLLVLGGRRATGTDAAGEFQQLDAVPIFASITKAARTVTTTDSLAGEICAGARLAMSGRPGPVYLDLPENVLNAAASLPENLSCAPDVAPAPAEADLDRAAELLLSAARPAVIFGKGVRWSDAYESLHALVELLGAPFIAAPMGRGLLPDEHPLCGTSVAAHVQAEADVVLVVGALLNWQFRFGNQLAPDARVIAIDIHAPQLAQPRAPAVGLVGDARRVLDALLERVRADEPRARSSAAGRSAWLAALGEKRAGVARTLATKAGDDRVPVSVHRLMREIRDFISKRDAVTVLDGHLALLAAQEMIPCPRPLTRLTLGANGCLGTGIPFALAAKLALADRTVVAICGDSAFGFNAMELETAVRHGIPIIVVVADNQGIWGGHIQRAHYPAGHELVTMFAPGTRYDQLAAALGCHAELVESPAEIRPALERAAASGRAACIHVRLDPHETPPRQLGY